MNNWLTWALLAAFFAGATAVLAKVGIAGINPYFATAIRTTVAFAFIWIVAAQATSRMALESVTRKGWIFLALSGIATGLSWLCYFRALQMGQVSQVAALDKLSVVFAIAFAALFLGEAMTWHHLVGALLIVGGAILLVMR